MRGIKFFLGIILSIFLLSGAVNIKSNERKISLVPSNTLKQGQTVFIELRFGSKLENPYFLYNGKKISFYKQNNGIYRGILGVDAQEKPGKYELSLKDATGNLNENIIISVVPVKFPVQNIVISGSKSKLTASKYELNKVQKAKTTHNEQIYWSDPLYNSPTKGCVISVYGLGRYHNGISTGDYHKGVDIKAPKGEAIRAVTGGKVLIAEQLRLHGGTVAIDHGQGLTSFYLHMSKITVKPGNIVKQDQKIGEVGSTGFATGPHLHWGLYVNGVPVNPSGFWVKPVPKC